ncbi:MAG: T9SS type A sorting domain-containing protein [Saprospiraceae bacterium]
MTDAIGRKVYVHKITENNNIHQLDVSNYGKGLYLLTIKIDGLDPVVKRVVVE